MYTVCPKCALTLLVTAADLRVAQGYVRCGRCSNVFNAVARLCEDRQSAASPQVPVSGPAAASSPPPQAPDALHEGDTAGHDPAWEEDADEIPEAALEFNPEATDVSEVFIEPPPSLEWTAATGSFKAIVLQSEDFGPTPPVESPASTSPAPTSPGQTFPASASGAQTSPAAKAEGRASAENDSQYDFELDAESVSAGTRRAPSQHGAQESGELDSDDEGIARAVEPAPPASAAQSRSLAQIRFSPEAKTVRPAAAEPTAAQRLPVRTGTARSSFDARGPERVTSIARNRAPPPELEQRRSPFTSRRSILWSAGTAALVIVLAAQIVHHFRHDLAADAHLQRPLTAFYAALGLPIVPRWDLQAYDVRQLGASVEGTDSGQITVRASVKNGARQAQPLPLLRVTLQDRFGNRIAARDVPPQSYLPRAIPGAALLSAGQRIDAEMAFVDPGSNAVGFEIDACLPAPGGGIACASDTTSR